MVKILINNRLYNIKDSEFNELREADRKNNIGKILKKIEETHPIKGYINPYNYKGE